MSTPALARSYYHRVRPGAEAAARAAADATMRAPNGLATGAPRRVHHADSGRAHTSMEVYQTREPETLIGRFDGLRWVEWFTPAAGARE